jgi:hypothetical protein
MIGRQAVDLTTRSALCCADKRRSAGAAENPADQTEAKDKE